MSLTGQVRRLAVGEQQCKVIVEVADLGPAGWRRLTADPDLCWRRLSTSRQSAAPRRRRGRAVPPPRSDSAPPMPALLEAVGVATGTAAAAKQRLAARALARLRAAGLDGTVLGAAPTQLAEPMGTAGESAWPASHGVLIFGPAQPAELSRRFALAMSAWSLNPDEARPPAVPEPGERRQRIQLDLVTGLCVLPLLVMAVGTVGPWLDIRTWGLLLAAAVVWVALPLLVAQALVHRRPYLMRARGRVLRMSAVIVALLLLARVLARIPVPPLLVTVLAAVLLAVLTPVVLRTLPPGVPVRAILTGVSIMLVLVAAPVGDLLDGVYLHRLDLRTTDVSLSLAERWCSGAFFGLLALAGLAVVGAVWGGLCRPGATSRRLPPAPAVTLLGAVYGSALLALAATMAWQQAGAAPGHLPGRWGGIAPVWVCWSSPGGGRGATNTVPFAGRALPPTDHAVAWLGSADGRHALWSPEVGGVLVSDQVRLHRRDQPGRC